MKRRPSPTFNVAPTDDQLMRCWTNERMNTADISARFYYPEYCVDSRLWRLLQEQRERTT